MKEEKAPAKSSDASARTLMFGERCIKLNLISREQLHTALKEQHRRREAGDKILLGMLMLEMAFLDNIGLVRVLKTYEDEKNAAE